MSTNFFLKYLQNWAKYPIFSLFREQMNQLTDTQTKNFNFLLDNLWDRSRGRCPPILVKISTKLSKISHFLNFQWTMNQLTDTQTKNVNFVLANLWYRSRGRCPPILVKIAWKLSDFSNFISEGVRVSGCDNPRCIARQLAKASGWSNNYFISNNSFGHF